MKKIFITGAGGFIGSQLVEECVSNNFEVVAFVHYNSKNSWGWLDNNPIKEDIEIISGDIRDYDSVSKNLKRCDTVFHLAALIGIPYSYESPLAYVNTNVIGTYNVLEAVRQQNIENVIITSTSETYGTAQYIPIDETHPQVGQSPYSATKISADQLAISYYRSFGTPVKIARPFNTYGPRQSARAIIPSIIIQILSGTENIKLGNKSPSRDLTYVKDTVKGFIAIAANDDFNGQAVNIGSGTEITIADLVDKITELMESDCRVSSDNLRIRPSMSEVERLCCDNSLLLSSTKWKPEYNLDKGLLETIKWLKANIMQYKTGIYNV